MRAWFQSPGAFVREEVLRAFAEPPPGVRLAQIAANGAEAGEDAGDVAVEDGQWHVIGDAQHCGGGVTADAGEREGGFERAGEFSAVTRCDFARCAMQISRAAVISEAGPEFQNFFEPCAAQRGNRRKFFEETMVIRKHGGDARLLQHNFRHPDAIGIAAGAPGKVAAVRGEPVEQRRLKFRECAWREGGVHAVIWTRAILAWRRSFSLGE